MAINISSLRKWKKLDKAKRQRLLENVFCIECSVTTIIDYEVTMGKAGIVLMGKCKKCGKDVSRVVEED